MKNYLSSAPRSVECSCTWDMVQDKILCCDKNWVQCWLIHKTSFGFTMCPLDYD